MIKAVLFDLDGTLLPMNYDEFSRVYFGSLAKNVAPLGYEPEKFPRFNEFKFEDLEMSDNEIFDDLMNFINEKTK